MPVESPTKRDVVLEALRRRQTDGLTLFRALTPDAPGVPENTPDQKEIIGCQATEVMIRGGNRSGKSTCSAVRCAAIARDRTVRTMSGEEFSVRLPHQVGKPLEIWIIGLQLNHIGQTIYRLLFKPGLFKTIVDEETGLIRPYREWDEADRARKHEVEESPPLIPESEIDPDGWSWEKKSEDIFTQCKLKNGTVIHCFASTADVKQGDPVDYIWIDERIAYPSHYAEWRMRLLDRDGSMCWSSKAAAGNYAMTELSEKAESQAEEVASGEREEAHIIEFRLDTGDNPTLSEASLTKGLESLSAEEIAVRFRGEYETGNAKIYPYFSNIVCAAVPDNPEKDDLIARILRDNNGVPPNDWCHELILDPGTIKPAVLLGAIPPPHLWGCDSPVIVAYKEIYGRRMDATQIAQAVKELTPEGRVYNRMIIDGQAGRQTPMSYSNTIAENYSEEFSKVGLKTSVNGRLGLFIEGDPNFKARSSKLSREYLVLQDNGCPRLRIVNANCHALVWQLRNNHFKIDFTTNYVDDTCEAPRQKNDVRHTLEYWISRDPKYVPPPSRKKRDEDVYQLFQRDVKRRFNHNSNRKSPTVNIGGATV